MTDIYLAYNPPVYRLFHDWDWETEPVNILVALPYLTTYQSHAGRYAYAPANLMLDSGAFSAWRSGHRIDIDQLITESKAPHWTLAVGLDVIGDAEATRRNMDYMRAQGSLAMPVFHLGDPWELLQHYCEHWPVVGLSCRFGEGRPESMRFYEQCFARGWPHRFHSFGWTDFEMLERFPFATADSSTWEQAPLAWSRFRIYDGAHLRNVPPQARIRSLVGQVKHYARQQDKLRAIWGPTLAKLEDA